MRGFCYDGGMRLLLACLLFGVAVPAAAYELHHTEIPEDFRPMSITLSADEQDVFLGELNEAPILYEAEISEGRSLPLQLFQERVEGAEPIPLSVLIVRQNGGNAGVSEVARFRADNANWSAKKDRATAITFLESDQYAVILEPGSYLIEVSTPENVGKYKLHIGEDVRSLSYFSSLSNTYQVQQFFDRSVVNMLLSPYVYVPLSLVLVLTVAVKTRKLRAEAFQNEE